jgi:tetrahydromethanopterin S-methyltransferase subunit A
MGYLMTKAEDFGYFLTRTFATTKNRKQSWPFIPGKYFVHDTNAPVAVTTLGSVALAKAVSDLSPAGLCIVGKVETENIGIEKIIKNILSNKAIQCLVCAGNEPPKHLTGATFLALFENGIDTAGNIIGSPGMRPNLPNTTAAEVEEFRSRIQPVDMLGETDPGIIATKVAELAASITSVQLGVIQPKDTGSIERCHENEYDPKLIKLDKSGYFVINLVEDHLLIEHYDYKERLQRTIEGKSARNLYLTIIEKEWVSRIDHAAYLGKELARAEHALREGLDFTQDGA